MDILHVTQNKEFSITRAYNFNFFDNIYKHLCTFCFCHCHLVRELVRHSYLGIRFMGYKFMRDAQILNFVIPPLLTVSFQCIVLLADVRNDIYQVQDSADSAVYHFFLQLQLNFIGVIYIHFYC